MAYGGKCGLKYFIELKDKRNNYVYMALKGQAYDVEEFVFEKSVLSFGDTVIFSPARKLSVDEANSFLEKICVIGGNFSSEIKDLLKEKNIKYINLLEDNSFVVKNANLTAEGVLALIIKETELSIFKNKILIIGTGKVGTSIAVLLKQLNLDFTFITFHTDKISHSNFFTDKVYLNSELFEIIENYDVIINTAPDKVILDKMLEKINENAVVLEIASINCLDKNLANNYKFRYILAPALPQVFSAKSAGDVMLESILKYI